MEMGRLAQMPGKAYLSSIPQCRYTGSEKVRSKGQAQNSKKPASNSTLKKIQAHLTEARTVTLRIVLMFANKF